MRPARVTANGGVEVDLRVRRARETDKEECEQRVDHDILLHEADDHHHAKQHLREVVEDEQLQQRRHFVEGAEFRRGSRRARVLRLLLDGLQVNRTVNAHLEIEDTTAADDDANEEAEEVEEDVSGDYGVHDAAGGEDAELGGIHVLQREERAAEEAEEAEVAASETRRATSRVDEEDDLDDDGEEPEEATLSVEDVHGHVDAEEEQRNACHVARHAHDHRQVVHHVQNPHGVLLRISHCARCHPKLHVVVLRLRGGPNGHRSGAVSLGAVVLLVDESEVVESGQSHDHAVHDGVEVADVHGLDAAEVCSATQAEEFENLALEVGLDMRRRRREDGEEKTNGNLDDADEGGV